MPIKSPLARLLTPNLIRESQLIHIQVGLAAVELVTSLAAFWSATAADYRRANPRTTDMTDNRMKEALLMRPAARTTWLCATFLLGYVGVEVATGGWVVTFMINVRHAGAFAGGMTATGFWLGMTVGRVILGFITPRIGEKLAISVSTKVSQQCECHTL